ncbi:MAG: hypothetical protein JWO52_141 [Gammaproteobacteria bacterium]|nr:hypothetical protein [Gammaproteobacteria bacterium]
MRCASTLMLVFVLAAAAMQSIALEADPNSGCQPQGSEPVRQRPGEGPPERLRPAECDPTRLPIPSASPLPGSIPVDRWRIIDALGYPDNRRDPYATNNALKGDRPIWGPDGFSVLTVSTNSLLESRHVPTSLDAATGQLAGHQQFFDSQTATIDAVLYEGDTIFRPPDYQLRITPILNYSSTNTGATKTTTTTVGAQAFFFEKHLRDVSANYDFDSVRIGIQPVTSDFRGFVLADQPLGVRFFGTRDNDVYQYSAGWFRRLPKNAARQNDLGAGIPANDLLMANLYVQDLGKPGLTSEFVLIYDRSRAPGTRVVLGGANPTFMTGARHDYDVIYLGYGADGHIGRLNLTGSLYEVIGRESQGVFTAGATRVQASFAALELSRDFDWIRIRASGLYASGDGNPADGQSHGFDGINQSALFAGTDSTFFIHQRLPLVLGAIDLKQRDSLFPSLRSTVDTGESNFTNPGLELLGVGTDLDLAPALRVSFDVDRLSFDRTAPLQAILGGAPVSRTIGTDASVDAIYRPFISQNVIARLSVGKLFPVPAARNLVGGTAPFSMFFNLVLTY